MPMCVQEVHPAIAHFPVALLPTAVAADLIGRLTDNNALMEVGRQLMPVAAASVAATGIAGFAAQEAVRTRDVSHDLLVTHRTLNIGLLALSVGLAAVRARSRRPSAGYLLAGLAGAALVTYSGYLGGRMVYAHGVGVDPADGVEHERAPEMPRNGFRRAARTAADNVGQALRHTAHDTAEGKITPRFQERASTRSEPAAG
ncbi:DUF2231 domain-containing protein [Microvirga makkahensis]|uniref:DUF2231 domain-containing protein n=1 Tax=Microvirga makkahensis TaxID=1128670 RepID=A0A7X3SQG8_9HYPH|nr:DUF2231 domain-containing protein [Microvirga makkahensis]MXQ13502.1 DUF2231 domain-containing protein [Microvirga makkahensis]